MYRIIFLLFLIPFSSHAQLSLPKFFTDNMLLQRNKPIHLWGRGMPGNTVNASFAGSGGSARVKADSTWSIYLKQQQANTTPQTLKLLSGTDSIMLENIIVGDIWLCIGQSNMEWPMEREAHFNPEIASARQPMLRFYNPVYAGKNIFGTAFSDSVTQRLTTENFMDGKWESCDSNSFRTMSAIAYYFGKQIAAQTNVPIGLINISIGGAPLESFIAEDALLNSRQFSAKLNGNWLSNPALPVWVRERGLQNIGGSASVSSDEYGKAHAYKPGFAYAASIEPLLPMPIKGILNYQGESNAQEVERVKEYAQLTKLLVKDLRKKWRSPKLPYYYVQLSSIDTQVYKGQLWPEFRDEQRKTLALIPYSGMAVSSDKGAKNDVHPTNKKAPAERLARWALNKTYGLSVVPSGPLPLSANYADGQLKISFNHLAGGLKTVDGQSLSGFSTDGKNKVSALISGNYVIIISEKKPTYVYYGWKPFSDGNLVNSENLPASTFSLKVR